MQDSPAPFFLARRPLRRRSGNRWGRTPSPSSSSSSLLSLASAEGEIRERAKAEGYEVAITIPLAECVPLTRSNTDRGRGEEGATRGEGGSFGGRGSRGRCPSLRRASVDFVPMFAAVVVGAAYGVSRGEGERGGG